MSATELIRITEETKNKLDKKKRSRETYDDVIAKMIKQTERKK